MVIVARGHAEARLHVERAIRIVRVAPKVPRSSDYGYDDRTAARTQLSRILWIQGFADQATAAARDVIAEAVSQDHAPSVCFALAMAACPIAFWVGDRDASRRYVDVLLEHSNKNSLCFWRGWQISTTSSLSRFRSRRSRANRSIAQKQIAPNTIILRTPIRAEIMSPIASNGAAPG